MAGRSLGEIICKGGAIIMINILISLLIKTMEVHSRNKRTQGALQKLQILLIMEFQKTNVSSINQVIKNNYYE